MKNLIFRIKYKFGIAKEGKDFFTCGKYYFCAECSEDKPICVTDTVPITKPKF